MTIGSDKTNKRYVWIVRFQQTGNSYPGLAFAFQTAAEHFSVIEGCHLGIVVPYKRPDGSCEALKLVSDFKNTYDTKTRSKILRKLQPFTVSVFANRESDIQQISEKVGECFYLLSSDHYDSELGLTASQGLLTL